MFKISNSISFFQRLGSGSISQNHDDIDFEWHIRFSKSQYPFKSDTCLATAIPTLISMQAGNGMPP